MSVWNAVAAGFGPATAGAANPSAAKGAKSTTTLRETAGNFIGTLLCHPGILSKSRNSNSHFGFGSAADRVQWVGQTDAW